jgi:hypothetical protein
MDCSERVAKIPTSELTSLRSQVGIVVLNSSQGLPGVIAEAFYLSVLISVASEIKLTDISWRLVQGSPLEARSSHVKDARSTPKSTSLRFVAGTLGRTNRLIHIVSIPDLEIGL